MPARKTPEGCVSRAVQDLLAAERVWFRRMNSGATKIEATETRKARFLRYGSPGMADILATPKLPGHAAPVLLWIETKSARGDQRVRQREFQQEVETEGHHYLLARSSDDVLQWLLNARTTQTPKFAVRRGA